MNQQRLAFIDLGLSQASTARDAISIVLRLQEAEDKASPAQGFRSPDSKKNLHQGRYDVDYHQEYDPLYYGIPQEAQRYIDSKDTLRELPAKHLANESLFKFIYHGILKNASAFPTREHVHQAIHNLIDQQAERLKNRATASREEKVAFQASKKDMRAQIAAREAEGKSTKGLAVPTRKTHPAIPKNARGWKMTDKNLDNFPVLAGVKQDPNKSRAGFETDITAQSAPLEPDDRQLWKSMTATIRRPKSQGGNSTPNDIAHHLTANLIVQHGIRDNEHARILANAALRVVAANRRAISNGEQPMSLRQRMAKVMAKHPVLRQYADKHTGSASTFADLQAATGLPPEHHPEMPFAEPGSTIGSKTTQAPHVAMHNKSRVATSNVMQAHNEAHKLWWDLHLAEPGSAEHRALLRQVKHKHGSVERLEANIKTFKEHINSPDVVSQHKEDTKEVNRSNFVDFSPVLDASREKSQSRKQQDIAQLLGVSTPDADQQDAAQQAAQGGSSIQTRREARAQGTTAPAQGKKAPQKTPFEKKVAKTRRLQALHPSAPERPELYHSWYAKLSDTDKEHIDAAQGPATLHSGKKVVVAPASVAPTEKVTNSETGETYWRHVDPSSTAQGAVARHPTRRGQHLRDKNKGDARSRLRPSVQNKMAELIQSWPEDERTRQIKNNPTVRDILADKQDQATAKLDKKIDTIIATPPPKKPVHPRAVLQARAIAKIMSKADPSSLPAPPAFPNPDTSTPPEVVKRKKLDAAITAPSSPAEKKVPSKEDSIDTILTKAEPEKRARAVETIVAKAPPAKESKSDAAKKPS